MKETSLLTNGGGGVLGLYGFGLSPKKLVIYVLSLVSLYYCIGIVGNIYVSWKYSLSY